MGSSIAAGVQLGSLDGIARCMTDNTLFDMTGKRGGRKKAPSWAGRGYFEWDSLVNRQHELLSTISSYKFDDSPGLF